MANTDPYKKNYSGYNLGISMLKMLACFLVIVSHIWGVNIVYTGPLGWIYFLREYAVPVFMILAFFFSQKMITQSDWDKIFKRIIKLIVPLFVWALIYWIFYKLLQEFLYPGYDLKVKDLFLQMFTGNSVYLNGTMWFQVNLIVLTLALALIVFVANKFHNELFALCAIVCIYLQYAGTMLFIYKFKAEIAGSVGRLHEMIPMAVIGYFLAYYGLLEKSRKHWITTILVSLVSLWMIRYYTVIPKPDVQTFDYGGLRHIVLGLILIFMFYAPPLEKLPKFVHVIVEWLTKYTLGIYCMHRLVGTLLHYFISHRTIDIETFTFFDCVLIYVISYVISFLIARIPCKWTRMLVE